MPQQTSVKSIKIKLVESHSGGWNFPDTQSSYERLKRKFIIHEAPGVPYRPRHWALASRNEEAFRKSQKWVGIWCHELLQRGVTTPYKRGIKNELQRGVTTPYKRGIKIFPSGTLVFKKISMPTTQPMVQAPQARPKLLRDQDVPTLTTFHNHNVNFESYFSSQNQGKRFNIGNTNL